MNDWVFSRNTQAKQHYSTASITLAIAGEQDTALENKKKNAFFLISAAEFPLERIII